MDLDLQVVVMSRSQGVLVRRLGVGKVALSPIGQRSEQKKGEVNSPDLTFDWNQWSRISRLKFLCY